MHSPLLTAMLFAAVAASGLQTGQATKVTIDVKPGDTPTTVERGREGMLPVAILSTAQFDALTVDAETIRVGPTGTEAEPVRSMEIDANSDRRADLQVLVRVRDLKLTCEHKAIRLTAKTTAGMAIEGSEAVTITDCKSPVQPSVEHPGL